MYLEITGRATGKTSRLIKAAKDYLRKNPNKIIVIFGASHYTEKKIRSAILKASSSFQNRVFISGEGWHGLYGKHFYDEFDYIKNIEINKRHYYSGTPKRKRTMEELNNPAKDDNLARLLKLNNRKHIKYHAPPNLTRDCPFFSTEEFDLEILGNYIKL